MRTIRRWWYKVTGQRAWVIFTPNENYRFIGRDEPPKLEGETARVSVCAWLQFGAWQRKHPRQPGKGDGK